MRDDLLLGAQELIDYVTQVLRDLRIVEGARRVRYNVVITRGVTFVIEAHPDNHDFYHIKVTEIDPESVRACFEATRRARQLFGTVVPRPIVCIRQEPWEVFVSEGVHFEPLRTEDLLSPSGRAFQGVIDFLSHSRHEAIVPGRIPHSRFLTDEVLPRTAPADLEAAIRPWLSTDVLDELDRLPHVSQHGDFVMANLGSRRHGIVIFDWEDFGRLTLPGVDLMTLLLSLLDFDGQRMRDIANPFSRDQSEYETLVHGGCGALALDPALFRRLLPLYLLEFLYLKFGGYTSRIQERIAAVIRIVCR